NNFVISSDCSAVGVTSYGYSIVAGSCSVSGTYAHVNPMLGPLQDNGGASGPTYALLAGSPAIDAGPTTGYPDFDQRGVPRTGAGASDIGAYEHSLCGDANGDRSVDISDV